MITENIVKGEQRYIDLDDNEEGEEGYAKLVFTNSMKEIYINDLSVSFGGKNSKCQEKLTELGTSKTKN